jgi:hypothetical protein
MPNLDEIGMSQIWFKWMYYNDEVACSEEPGTCLDDIDIIEGNDSPFSYTTFYTWDDFYDAQEIETIYFIMVATSFVGILAWPALFVISIVFLVYMFLNGIQGYFNARLYENSDRYSARILNMLTQSLSYSALSCVAFNFYTL